LEHPEGSHAFAAQGIARPTWRAGWIAAGDGLGHVACVAQGNYGHRARKLTWLYAVGTERPELDWTIPAPRSRLDFGYHSVEERHKMKATRSPVINRTRLNHFENLSTPIPFRDLLLRMASSVTRRIAT
jgi:hypothetical protein